VAPFGNGRVSETVFPDLGEGIYSAPGREAPIQTRILQGPKGRPESKRPWDKKGELGYTCFNEKWGTGLFFTFEG
jgi:hypothetical protein